MKKKKITKNLIYQALYSPFHFRAAISFSLFFFLKKKKSYKGGSFSLLIQNEEEVGNLINKKGVGSPTLD
jgi:hypothetical protein